MNYHPEIESAIDDVAAAAHGVGPSPFERAVTRLLGTLSKHRAPAPASEDERAQAARWALARYERAWEAQCLKWDGLPVHVRDGEITAMLPLVREARAAVDRVADGLNVVLSEKPRLLSKVQAERDAALREIERLCVRPAPLTEKEAGQIARTFTDGLAGFDLPEDVEALTDLLVRISRGDIPPEVRTLPTAYAERERTLTNAPTTTKGEDSITNTAIDKMLDARQAILGVCAALEKIDATSFQRAAEGIAATREAVCEALSLCDPRPVLLTEGDVDDVARYAWGAKEIRTPSPDAWAAVPEAERVGWRAVARTIDIRLRHFSRRTTVAPVSAPAVDWLVELFWALQGMRSASLEGRHRLQERVELLMANARDQEHVATILAMVRAKGGGAK